MSDGKNITINSGTKEEVAFELFKYLIMNLSAQEQPKNKDDFLKLYATCLKCVKSTSYTEKTSSTY